MTSLLVSLTIRADYSTAVLRYISPNLYAPEGATCFEDKGVRPGLQNMERLSAIWQPLLSGVEPGGSVGFGAAGGQEVAGTLGFVAEEVDAEGELGAGFDALLVGVGVAGCGGDEAIVQADDGDVDEIQRGGVGVEVVKGGGSRNASPPTPVAGPASPAFAAGSAPGLGCPSLRYS